MPPEGFALPRWRCSGRIRYWRTPRTTWRSLPQRQRPSAAGEAERAKVRMNRALLIDPDNFSMRYNFACGLCVYQHDKNAALEMLELCSRGSPPISCVTCKRTRTSSRYTTTPAINHGRRCRGAARSGRKHGRAGEPNCLSQAGYPQAERGVRMRSKPGRVHFPSTYNCHRSLVVICRKGRMVMRPAMPMLCSR